MPAARGGVDVYLALAAGTTVETGDGLLYVGRLLRPPSFSRGDLVVYDIPQRNSAAYVVQAGVGLDRIVAVPDDRVEIRAG